jgi:hypothetical protein
MIDDADVLVLERSQQTHETVRVTVTGCAFACCSRGWVRRDGYEQTYEGYVDNLKLPEAGMAGTFMLYGTGVGTVSYVVAVRFYEVAAVAALHPV